MQSRPPLMVYLGDASTMPEQRIRDIIVAPNYSKHEWSGAVAILFVTVLILFYEKPQNLVVAFLYCHVDRTQPSDGWPRIICYILHALNQRKHEAFASFHPAAVRSER
ncbi:hypothetical protein SLS60_011800 [Paraconiothyrium brasiliense]|uniref:Transposase n=1 Tax=Paraconiothyrium brasiliense TaxID=300254 RepID=A0ABR3QI80_9PLEO